mmetsp:Transcript_29475/g.40934  ORF Transcript_29475/g.40934 Transcript_29475/m.40934 type:complete len:133 (+) Transcript_29475:1887-2285(+)
MILMRKKHRKNKRMNSGNDDDIMTSHKTGVGNTRLLRNKYSRPSNNHKSHANENENYTSACKIVETFALQTKRRKHVQTARTQQKEKKQKKDSDPAVVVSRPRMRNHRFNYDISHLATTQWNKPREYIRCLD